MNNLVKNAVYMSIFGTSLCLTACGNTNKQDNTATPTEDSTGSPKPIDTEMDSVVSPDTVMPAP